MDNNIKKITICIPVCEQRGYGYDNLKRLLESIKEQTYKDYDVVVSDNSTYFAKDKMKKICDEYDFVKYIHNPIIGMSENTNNAIKNATGEYIKLMYQDDWFATTNALEEIIDEQEGQYWTIVGANNNPQPYWTDDIETGNNKLGSPSALFMKNEDPILFDEPMTWLLDCDYYRRLYDKYGEPKILSGAYINIGTGEHQVTNTLTAEEKEKEVNYLKTKYEKN